MSFITICGGGGKTTICEKYPNLFLDIDSFIWSEYNKEYHCDLVKAINTQNIEEISNIYKKIMINNRDKISKDKIILGHNSINAEWLNIKCIYSIKPNMILHRKNIEKRENKLKKIAINCWNNQKDAHLYNSYQEFEEKLLNFTI